MTEKQFKSSFVKLVKKEFKNVDIKIGNVYFWDDHPAMNIETKGNFSLDKLSIAINNLGLSWNDVIIDGLRIQNIVNIRLNFKNKEWQKILVPTVLSR